jgi:transcriptional regulator with XRE-family HTH domain
MVYLYQRYSTTNIHCIHSKNHGMAKFSEFIKTKRLDKRMTLREFCEQSGFDPSNWSKVERGIGEVPKSNQALEKVKAALELNDAEYEVMRDLALIDSFPEDLRPADDILEKLPAFFRGLRDGQQMSELMEHLKQS